MPAERRPSHSHHSRPEIGMLPNMTTNGTDLESNYVRVNSLEHPGFFSARRVPMSPPSSPNRDRRAQKQESEDWLALAPKGAKEILKTLDPPNCTPPRIQTAFAPKTFDDWKDQKNFTQDLFDRPIGLRICLNGTMNYGSLKPLVVVYDMAYLERPHPILGKYHLKACQHGCARIISEVTKEVVRQESFHLWFVKAPDFDLMFYLGVYRAYKAEDSIAFQYLDFDERFCASLLDIEAKGTDKKPRSKKPSSRNQSVSGPVSPRKSRGGRLYYG
ncbi:hypothetical protein CERSUDRAFT_97624 [Gelatoporia subvermispora B]|uniref:Uncharacterized protein n=1 Tax=Ceriporiopsis subvermispora (strain B) TaxID=914234 RepID=M2QBK0_CERS8|nr:hypothetical protein CERSUDRAFT_97624 [Gelatoporia subvermispora B]